MSKAANTTDSWLSRRGLARLLVMPMCVLTVAAHLNWGDDAYPFEALLCAGLIGCVSLLSFAYSRPNSIPALPVLLGYFYVAMARPTFAPPVLRGASGPIRLSRASYTEALAGALVFALCAVVGSFLLQRRAERWGQRLSTVVDNRGHYGRQETLVARCVAFLSLAFCSIQLLNPLLIPPSIAFLFSLLASPAISLGLLYWDSQMTSTKRAQLLFWMATSYLVLVGLGTGSLGSAIMPGLIAAVLVWTIQGRVPFALIATGTLFLLVFNPAKYAYRDLTWYSNEDTTVESRIDGWAEALSRTYSGDSEEALSVSSETTAYRTATLPFVALVFDLVPRQIRHAGPDRWLELPTWFIPRALWPDKPSHTELFNNDFTLTFGLQTRSGTRTTTLNLPSVGDGYWRLGWLGVVSEGLLLGLVIGLFQGIAIKGSRGLLIMGTNFVATTQADKHVFHLLGSLPQFFLATSLMLLAVRYAASWLTAKPAGPSAIRSIASRTP